jgi:hypothetical protein
MKYAKYPQNLILFAILLSVAVSAAFGQKAKTPVKSAPKKTVPATKTAAAKIPAKVPVKAAPIEISQAEWNALVEALDKENWTQAALLASAALGKLKTDNDKKQQAQLRYFYLYALAGKAADGKITYAELLKTADSFIGKEFLMPSRQFLADCAAKVNFICATKDNENAVRVTATNKSGSAIHSFEYVKLAEKPDIAANDGKAAFVGGTLQKAEINLYKQNISIMRLIFDKGFVNIVASR